MRRLGFYTYNQVLTNLAKYDRFVQKITSFDNFNKNNI